MFLVWLVTNSCNLHVKNYTVHFLAKNLSYMLNKYITDHGTHEFILISIIKTCKTNN